MVWNKSEVEKSIWSKCTKEDGSIDVPKARKCFLLVEGEPSLRGSYHYPYRMGPESPPDQEGLLAAQQRANGPNGNVSVARKAASMRKKGGMTETESEMCSTCPAMVYEGESSLRDSPEAIVPITVIKAGVFNGAMRSAEEISRSTKLWEGVPIIFETVGGVVDHPPDGIVTNRKQVVGQLRDVWYDGTAEAVRGNGYFTEDLGAPPAMIDALASGAKVGVSGCYFKDSSEGEGEYEGKKFNRTFSNILPNNLAIVENPACKIGMCGINVESIKYFDKDGNEIKIPGIGRESNDFVSMSLGSDEMGNIEVWFPKEKFGKDIPFDRLNVTNEEEFKNIGIQLINLIANIAKISLEHNDGGNVMGDEITKEMFATLKTESESVKTENESVKKTVAEKEAEIVTLKASVESVTKERDAMKVELDKIALESKKVSFISKFPAAAQEAATKELLPVFLESPEKLALEHGNRFAELMGVATFVADPKGAALEHVPAVEGEEAEYAKLGVPSIAEIKKQFGV